MINDSQVSSKNTVTALKIINIETLESQVVDKRKCTITSDGYYNGDIIIYCGGLDRTIYYQVVSLDNEILELEGSAIVYGYSFSKQEMEKVLSLKQKVQFITGDEERLYVSEYSFEDANVKTGKIYSISDNTIQSIPNIDPVFDIRGCKRITKNEFVFYNIQNFYVTNTQNKTCYYDNYVNLENERAGSLKFYENSIGCMIYSEKEVWFRKYSFV